jgi:hypothetical protein
MGGLSHVTRVVFSGVPNTCENGKSGISGDLSFSSEQGRIRHGEWDARKEFFNGDFDRLAGEFVDGRAKAEGIFKDRTTFSQPTGVCRTGKREWVAKKQ